MTQQIFETAGGLYLGTEFLGQQPCPVTVDGGKVVVQGAETTYTATRQQGGWYWTGKANSPARAGREMQAFLSRIARRGSR